MYGSVLNFLIAIAILALAPRGTAQWDVAAGLHVLVYLLLPWVLLRFGIRRLMARALHDDAQASRLRTRFAGLVQGLQTGALLPFALLLYLTDYPALVIAPATAASEILGSLLGVAPYVVLLLQVWWEAYPLQGVLLGQSSTRPAFVAASARLELPVLVPWLVLMGFSDLLGWLWPAGKATLNANPVLQLLYAPAFLVLVAIFLPALIKSMWGCTPVPEGALRVKLEALCRALRVRVDEILYWPLHEGRVMTAGIVGLVPRFRYLLITPALAEVLPDDELVGVVAHEAGHVHHRHLWFYLVFFAGYVCWVAILFRLAEAGLAWWGIAEPEVLRDPRASLWVSLGITALLLVFLVAYFRFLFGAVSRAFERQADAYALEVIGRPGPLVRALERISYYSGDIRDLPSWHHGSIGERVAFLTAAAGEPQRLERFHRGVRRLVSGFGLTVLASGALAATLHVGPVDRQINAFIAEHGLLHRAQQSPRDADIWFLLGNLYYDAGREADAEHAYNRVLEIEPAHVEALNNLAWLYVSSADPERFRPERALALAEIAAGLRPAPHILDTLAEARYRVHDYRGALEAINQALVRNPDNRAYYEAQRDKIRQALEGS